MPTPRPSPRRLGFTLIEVLSVVAILALVAAFVAPNLGGLQARALRSEAKKIAAYLELARQRAIMTGVPHRVWMDLDEAEYRLEWLHVDPEAPAPPAPGEIDLRGNAPLPMKAPRAQRLVFQPVPGNFGNRQVVKDPFYFEGLETAEGWIHKGRASVQFEQDGSADHTEILIQDASGNRAALDVFPLDERVRIRHES